MLNVDALKRGILMAMRDQAIFQQNRYVYTRFGSNGFCHQFEGNKDESSFAPSVKLTGSIDSQSRFEKAIFLALPELVVSCRYDFEGSYWAFAVSTRDAVPLTSPYLLT